MQSNPLEENEKIFLSNCVYLLNLRKYEMYIYLVK